MKYGYFDDRNREYVITQPDTPLPWINYLGCQAYFGIISNTAGGYSFYRDARLRRLTRYRYNNVPVRLGRPLHLSARRRDRRVLVAESGSRRGDMSRTTHAATAWATRPSAPDISGIAAHTRYFVPLDENLEIWQFTVTNHAQHPRHSLSLRQHRILPVGCAGRRHQFPAQLQHRPGGSRRRRHLSQDRISRAPQSFRLVRLLRSRAALTRSAKRFLAAIAAGTARRRWKPAQLTNSVAHGWSPIGAHQVKLDLEPGETRQIVFVLGYHENPEDEKFDPPGSQTINKNTVKPVIAKYLEPGRKPTRHSRSLRELLGRPAGRLPGGHARHPHQPHGEHLECLSVHGDVQHVALGFVLRIGHRPRSRLPRFEPGPARLRAHGSVARPRAHSRSGRHAASQRRRLSPIPAAHQARQQRHRRRIQRRSALADCRRRRLSEGDRRLGAFSTSPYSTTTSPARSSRSTSTCSAASTTRLRASGRMACR